MVSSKEKLKKIFDDLLNLDFYVSIVYPIEVEPLVSKTADYLHTTTGNCYLMFAEACKAYHEQREQDIKLRYEVARWEAQIMIAPHCKGKPKLPLPWDKKTPVAKKADAKAVQSMTMEEALKKMGETL